MRWRLNLEEESGCASIRKWLCVRGCTFVVVRSWSRVRGTVCSWSRVFVIVCVRGCVCSWSRIHGRARSW